MIFKYILFSSWFSIIVMFFPLNNLFRNFTFYPTNQSQKRNTSSQEWTMSRHLQYSIRNLGIFHQLELYFFHNTYSNTFGDILYTLLHLIWLINHKIYIYSSDHFTPSCRYVAPSFMLYIWIEVSQLQIRVINGMIWPCFRD